MQEIASIDFDIQQIADSGQCFRMYQINDDVWEARALNRSVSIEKKYDKHIFSCSETEFQNFWFRYFDLGTDYRELKRRILMTNDEYLKNAVQYGSGLRILQQDVWEMIVSFVISQQNNIPRIKKCIQGLINSNNGKFPTAVDLLQINLDDLHLGYRKNYLIKIAEDICNENFSIETLKEMDCAEAIRYLKQLSGVGEKVANCVALFGLHKMAAFPVDVWIQRILDTYYDGRNPLDEFGLKDIGGLVQQYMYFYERRKIVSK